MNDNYNPFEGYQLEDSLINKLIIDYSSNETTIFLENVLYYSPMKISVCSLILKFNHTHLKKIMIDDLFHNVNISDVTLNKINNNLYNMTIRFTEAILSLDFRDVEITRYIQKVI